MCVVLVCWLMTNWVRLVDAIPRSSGRIRADIDEIADCYEHLWPSFSAAEQADVINETLIRPAAVLQYSNLEDPARKSSQLGKELGAGYDGRRLATFARQRTGLKRIQDDLCGVYRDEHSRPFAVKTKSQINLHLFATNDPDDVDETDNGGEEMTPVRTFVPRALPSTMAVPPPLPPQQATHSSPSKSIILPPPVSSTQLSPKNNSTKTSTNFLAKLINRSATSTTNSSADKDDQERLVDEDQQFATIVASSSLGLQSFSSTDIDPFDDDSSNFGESNALLSGSASTKPGIDTFQAKNASVTANANHQATRMTSRRRSGQPLTRDEEDDNDQDAPGAIRATYDFLNNW